MDKKLFIGLASFLLIVTFGIVLESNQRAFGSVNRSNDYQATTTFAMLGGLDGTAPTAASSHLYRVVGSGDNTLGSVVVASSSATAFYVWNATSTSDIASTSLGSFVASPANGTYTFDVVAPRGLIVDMPAGFNGSYTITFR